jgi:opacity protein-like surface antigen
MNIRIVLVSILLLVTLKANENNFFISQAVGISKHKVTLVKKSGNIILDQEPTTTGNSLNLELGYIYSNKYFSTISYSNISYTEITIDNISLSINRKYEIYSYEPYIGILYGTIKSKLKKSLINGSTKEDIGHSNIYGFQAAIQKKVNTNSYIYLQYKYFKTKYKRIIQEDASVSELSRNNFSNISLGVKYNF